MHAKGIEIAKKLSQAKDLLSEVEVLLYEEVGELADRLVRLTKILNSLNITSEGVVNESPTEATESERARTPSDGSR